MGVLDIVGPEGDFEDIVRPFAVFLVDIPVLGLTSFAYSRCFNNDNLKEKYRREDTTITTSFAAGALA